MELKEMVTYGQQMVHGGMNIEMVVTFLKSINGNRLLDSDTERELREKISAGRSKPISEAVREWVEVTSTGSFSTSDVFRGLQVTSRGDKKAVCLALLRMAKANVIERFGDKAGHYRIINKEIEHINWIDADMGSNLKMQYPLGIQEYVLTLPKNIVIIGGAKDSGKTAFLLCTAAFNRKLMKTVYFTSEMGEVEMKARLINLSEKLNIPIKELAKDIEWINKHGDFSDVIQPEALNIIDFLEITKDFFEIGNMIKDIYHRLTTGIAVIGVQKPTGRDAPLGGERGLEKARVAIALDNGKAKILVGKNWADEMVNPKGLECRFKILKGSEFILAEPWDKPKENGKYPF